MEKRGKCLCRGVTLLQAGCSLSRKIVWVWDHPVKLGCALGVPSQKQKDGDGARSSQALGLTPGEPACKRQAREF